jgi:hypothetical protein
MLHFTEATVYHLRQICRSAKCGRGLKGYWAELGQLRPVIANASTVIEGTTAAESQTANTLSGETFLHRGVARGTGLARYALSGLLAFLFFYPFNEELSIFLSRIDSLLN